LIALGERGESTGEDVSAITLSTIHRGLDFSQIIVFRRPGDARRYVAWRG
jgi:hypothetical protein